MSLRAFHILFILAAIALSFGFGFWCSENPVAGMPWAGRAALVLGWVLSVYLVWFVRKIRKDLGISR